jgi:chromosomal replication initiator protein
MIEKIDFLPVQFDEKEFNQFSIKKNLSLEEKEDLVKLYQFLKSGFNESAYSRCLHVIKYAGLRRERGAFVLIVPDLLAKNIILQSYFRDIAAFVSKNCQVAKKIEVSLKGDFQEEAEKFVTYYHSEKNLNFDTFLSSSSNKLAYWSARQTSEMIVRRQASPVPCLCIFGSVGMGKTHLTQAIVAEVKKLDPSCKIEYLSAEDFRERYFRAIRENNLFNFKQYFSSLDALVLDDVQFLSSGSGSSIERDFARILNQLIDNRRWIVLACDRPPNSLKFDSRTQARVASGLNIAIEQSDLDLRLMVLQAKLHELHQKDGLEISPVSLQYIAESVLSSIRSLESLLHIIVSHAKATRVNKLPESTIINLMKQHGYKNNQKNFSKVNRPDFHKLLDKVAWYYKIDKEEILGEKRLKSLSKARSSLAYLARQELSMTLKEIGLKMGRNHATIVYLLKSFEKDPLFLEELDKIINLKWKKT